MGDDLVGSEVLLLLGQFLRYGLVAGNIECEEVFGLLLCNNATAVTVSLCLVDEQGGKRHALPLNYLLNTLLEALLDICNVDILSPCFFALP